MTNTERENRPSAAEVTLRPMAKSTDDLALFGACFEKNSPRPRSREALDWQYLRNTTEKLYVDVAATRDGEKLAAIYASLPGWMRIDGKRCLVIQSLDTLTDEDYRGRGLFVTLANRTFKRATEDGVALVYGFPNGNSAHGFFKKLSWTALDPVPFLIRPLRTRYVAERLRLRDRLGKLGKLASFVPDVALVTPSLVRRGALPKRVIELRHADPRTTSLWERFAKGIGVALERDAAYLDWRLFRRPDTRYRVLATESPDGKALTAMTAYIVEDKHGGRIGYVMELMHDGTLRGVHDASRLLGFSVHDMAADGADAALAWSMSHSPSFPVYVRHGFVTLPERLRPIELHFGARAFDPAVHATITRRESWYLSYLDSDTV